MKPCSWGVKADMVRVWVAGKLCDSIVTLGPYLSTLEIGRNKALYKFTFFTSTVTLQTLLNNNVII